MKERNLVGFTLSMIMVASTMQFCNQAQEVWKNARLFDAVASGRKELVDAALRSGTDPNSTGPGFGSLLLYATKKKQLGIVKLLLSYGANPKAQGNEGLAAAAADTNDLGCLMTVVEGGAWVTLHGEKCKYEPPLISAAYQGNLEMVKYLLKRGADPNETSSLCDLSSLQIAARQGKPEIMELLLEAGADINHRDCNGMSALMHACRDGERLSVEFLLAHGADASFKDGYDQNAATFAEQLKGDAAKELKPLCSGHAPSTNKPSGK